MKLPGKIVVVLVIIIGIIAVTQIDFTEENTTKQKQKNPPKSLAHVATHTDNLSNFAVALKTANMVDSLEESGPYTVFAPFDQAFANLPEGRYQNLMKEKDHGALEALVKHHVVRGVLNPSDLSSGRIATLAGDSLAITYKNDTTRVDGAPIIQKKISASNGIIYVINRVLPTKR